MPRRRHGTVRREGASSGRRSRICAAALRAAARAGWHSSRVDDTPRRRASA